MLATSSLWHVVLLYYYLPKVSSPCLGTTLDFLPFRNIGIVSSHRELLLQKHQKMSQFIACKWNTLKIFNKQGVFHNP